MTYTIKELCECLHKEIEGHKRNTSFHVKDPRIKKEIFSRITKLQEIYRILINLPEEYLKQLDAVNMPNKQ